jgi:hypothetical protein
MENEINSSINVLDITICNINGMLEFKIYRKLTTTDKITHNDSCHPFEHKISAIKNLVNGMNTCPITEE